ncbi:MAG: response regulator [Deltaproteobacteria bacterium]|nr:response regulator [Deltaproteobacteria bacterium]
MLPRCDGPVALPLSPDAPAPRGRETVLLVEDDDDLRTLLGRMLGAAGYLVLAAGDGAAASRVLDRYSGSIHLILSDVILCEITGPELVGQLRERVPHARCLFMSGYSEDAARNNSAMPTGVHFIQKPFSSDALALRVRAVLDEPS